MRIARKLTLIATLALAATALAAPSALAQVEPELHNQAPRLLVAQEVHGANDVACSAVTPSPPPVVSPLFASGGCRLHFTSGASSVGLTMHGAGGFELEVDRCGWEFNARLDAAGEGWITHQEFVDVSGTCTRHACAQTTPPTGEARAYTIYLQEREVAGQGPREEAVVLICSAPHSDPSQIFHCEVTLPISQPTTHRYRLAANDLSGHGATFPHCEYNGQLEVEATLGTTGEGESEQNMEIRHT